VDQQEESEMKRLLAVPLMVLMVVAIASPALGGEADAVNGMGAKLARGFANVLTGWIEVPAQTVKGFNQGVLDEMHPPARAIGGLIGLFRGAFHAVGRTASGVVDLAGFFLADPADNNGVGMPLDAEYAWEEGPQHSIFRPNLKEGLTPIGRKLGRGLVNFVFGVVDFPAQIVKAGKEDKNAGIPRGFIKGLWFAVSRVFRGGTDAITFIFPNPPDNVGFILDQKYPWDAFSTK